MEACDTLAPMDSPILERKCSRYGYLSLPPHFATAHQNVLLRDSLCDSVRDSLSWMHEVLSLTAQKYASEPRSPKRWKNSSAIY
eukprot:1370558-Amorphochlora_amoeboformis.AAC.3